MTNKRYEKGYKQMEKMFGSEMTQTIRERLEAISKDFSTYQFEAFGSIYGRKLLDTKTRNIGACDQSIKGSFKGSFASRLYS